MRKQYLLYMLLLSAIALASCSKWDEYKQYTDAGETSYTGKMDSVKIFSGRLRLKITGLIPADPKITRTKISWNSDSVVYNISKGAGIDSFSRIIAVPEGIINFTVRNYDAAGNTSLPVTASGTAYGPKYESGLTNRPVASADLQTNGNTIIVWDAFDTTTGARATWVRYTKTNDTQDSVYVPVRQATTTIAGLKAGTSISLRTVYLPTPTAIDTFYAATTTRSVKADVTSLYLSNTGPNFTRASGTGRWGVLGAPWVTNAAAKNKDGNTNGGFSADEGGVINWETWGNTPVTNGIVYQATSAILPAGSYTVSFDSYSEVQTNSTVYCVAAAGGNGIPVLSDLSTALGSVGLFNGAVVGTTKPSSTDTRSFNFTLTSAQVVSIGFLGNLAGGAANNSTAGNYFQVKRIQLFKN